MDIPDPSIALTAEERAAVTTHADQMRREGWQLDRDGHWFRPPPGSPARGLPGPYPGDERLRAEEMIAEALIAAGLRPPNQRLFKLNSPEAYTHLARPFSLRGIRNEQSEDYVRIVTEWVPRGAGE